MLVAVLLIWAIYLALDGQPGAATVVAAIAVSPLAIQFIGAIIKQLLGRTGEMP